MSCRMRSDDSSSQKEMNVARETMRGAEGIESKHGCRKEPISLRLIPALMLSNSLRMSVDLNAEYCLIYPRGINLTRIAN